jgi:histidine decarboxylase
MSLPTVVNGAIGADPNYCMGYMNPGASGYGYISTLKLSTGIVSMEGLDPGTEGIVSYDRCEKNDAYIGQINMLTASSFCGVNGAVWGYHLGVADGIANGTLQPMFYQNVGGRMVVPVYPVKPLLDCAVRLFGVDEQRRFPPMPGAHVICANKNFTSDPAAGTGWVWAALALAIAENRETASNLFIEDAGFYAGGLIDAQRMLNFLSRTLRAVTKSMVMCGVDQKVNYSKIFAGYVYQFVPKGYVGCSLTCAPYVVLPPAAVPPNGQPSNMLGMTITQWERQLNLPPLPPEVWRGRFGDPTEEPAGRSPAKRVATKKKKKKKAIAGSRRGAKGR